MTKRVAIIGAAHRFPGTTPETFWQDLQAEKDLVTEVAADRWSHDAFLHPDKRHPGTSVTFAAGSLGDISGFDAEFLVFRPAKRPIWIPSSACSWSSPGKPWKTPAFLPARCAAASVEYF